MGRREGSHARLRDGPLFIAPPRFLRRRRPRSPGVRDSPRISLIRLTRSVVTAAKMRYRARVRISSPTARSRELALGGGDDPRAIPCIDPVPSFPATKKSADSIGFKCNFPSSRVTSLDAIHAFSSQIIPQIYESFSKDFPSRELSKLTRAPIGILE